MNVAKRILLYLFLSLVLVLGIFVYINLRQDEPPLPPITEAYGDEPDYRDRAWWESTTVYQIYPRSYQDSDGDGIGDLAGIISRLDYIRDLGFETIWLSPFFESPQRDFGYDVSDYREADPVYGDSVQVDSLIREVHRRDMKIVFDLVLNHSSASHPWFQESRRGEGNAKSDWYVWQEGDPDTPPSNWQSALTTQGWHYDEGRGAWYYAAFLPFQPDLNWRNPEVKEAMFDLTRYWLKRGVDGFRLDIFNFIYEDSLLRDNPFSLRLLPTQDLTKARWQHRKYNINHPDNFELAKEFRGVLEEFDDPARFAVGEVFGSHPTLKRFLGEDRKGLNLVFLFEIAQLKWDAGFFREHIRAFEAFYPYPYQPTYVFSNHDRPRSITLLGNDERRARLLALLQFTVRGVPFTYQGEEIGMRTADIPLSKAKDPLPAALRDILPGFLQSSWDELPFIFNRDNCRTPMQWTAGPQAGFTAAGVSPWLSVQSNAKSINVATQQERDTSILNTYRRLLSLRSEELPLKWGSLQLLEEGLPRAVLAFKRIYREEELITLINFSGEQQILPFSGKIRYLVGTAESGDGTIILAGNSGAILEM